MNEMKRSRNPEETRGKLVQATRLLVLHQGFNATGIDQICTEAGVTKGAFFHHFKSKDEIAKAALASWADFGMAIYAQAKSEPAQYPLQHVHRFFDIMMKMVEEVPPPLTCVVGIISQEMAAANEGLRLACSDYLGDWASFVRELLNEAKAMQRPKVDFDSAEVAWFLNSLWQGSMLIAKTRQEPAIVLDNLKRARAEIERMFSGESNFQLN